MATEGNNGASHSFLAEHSPRGAEASFALGRVGHGGGFSLEEGKLPDHDVLIGYERGGVVCCLPYCASGGRALESGMAEFIPTNMPSFGAAGASPVRFHYFSEGEVRRRFNVATDTWQAPGIIFCVASPAGGIPDPDCAPAAEMKEAIAPAIVARLSLDNSEGAGPMRGFFAVAGLPNLRFLEDETGGQLSGVASLRGYGLAVETARCASVQSFADFNLEHVFARPRPVRFRLAQMGGLMFEIAPGDAVDIDIALGWYRGGIVTSGRTCSYYYTRCFTDLADVLQYALSRSEHWMAEARKRDQWLAKRRLSSAQNFLVAKSMRSYYGSTQLLDDGGRPRWVVNEGSCNMINTLDLTVDMAFFEAREHPWLLRNVLDSYADDYSFYDEVHFPDRPDEAHRGGLSFTHDQGTRNAFSPRGVSSYELADNPGCFSHMTHEELLNWLLCAALYVHESGDRAWLHRRIGLVLDGLASLQRRDDPDPARRDGVMDLDSNRCGRESEITTYDSLDPSLGQARRNAYMAVKSWAAYLAVQQMLETEDEGRWQEHVLSALESASLCADTVTAGFDESLGYIPAILDGEDQSAIIPVIEALVYPDQLEMHGVIALDGPFGRMIRTLRQHFFTVLKPGLCLFSDRGWKLSSNNDNSWMSKIFLCQYVARKVLGIDFGELGARFDEAHARWWREGAAGHSVVDQVIAGKVPGWGSIYPRCVTAVLWLEE